MSPVTSRELLAIVSEFASKSAKVAEQAANAIDDTRYRLERVESVLDEVKRELQEANEARARRATLITRLAPLIFALLAGVGAAFGVWRNPGQTPKQEVIHVSEQQRSATQ